MALVLRNGLAFGRRAAVETALGINVGLVVWAALAAQTFLLAAIFAGMGLVWLTSYALLVAKAASLLRREPVRRALDAVTGTVLTALGVRVAVQR